MKDDCYSTCPKCGETGWCHYKGKARIFKSGPKSDTYKVSLFKCGNCGKKFGFELEDSAPYKKEENNGEEDWKQVYSILNDYIMHYCTVAFTPDELYSALVIAKKHC